MYSITYIHSNAVVFSLRHWQTDRNLEDQLLRYYLQGLWVNENQHTIKWDSKQTLTKADANQLSKVLLNAANFWSFNFNRLCWVWRQHLKGIPLTKFCHIRRPKFHWRLKVKCLCPRSWLHLGIVNRIYRNRISYCLSRIATTAGGNYDAWTYTEALRHNLTDPLVCIASLMNKLKQNNKFSHRRNVPLMLALLNTVLWRCNLTWRLRIARLQGPWDYVDTESHRVFAVAHVYGDIAVSCVPACSRWIIECPCIVVRTTS